MGEVVEYLVVGAICFLLASIRYLSMVAVYYFIVYRIFKEKFFRFKIQQEEPNAKEMRSEIFWGLVNNLNFSIVGMVVYACYQAGYLRLFFQFWDFSWYYHLALIFVLLYLHDAYFFWIHWLMHRTKLGHWLRHDVHHGSDNVSPWSAFSVHPFEGFFEVAFRLFTLLLIPMHPIDFIFFEILTFALNIIGHSGYEFFPSFFAKSPLTKMNSCATFHYLHHLNGRTNLSLFFNHWDRLMGTLHPNYEKEYEKVIDVRK